LPDAIGDRSHGQILKIPARKRRFSMTNVALTASEFHEHVGEAFDRSLNQPVVITKHGRPRNVVLSYGEHERLAARDRPRRGLRT
jgi:prevent-host-death family protein